MTETKGAIRGRLRRCERHYGVRPSNRENKMFLRAIPVVALVTSLSACGGSSDGSAVNPVQPPTPAPTQSATVLETFSDGSGVLRQVQVKERLKNLPISA